MSNELPPLPKPRVPAVIATAENTESVRKGYEMGGYEKSPPLFDEKQVLAYGRARERAAYERAAHLVSTYKVPIGNSAAGEMACEWTMEALAEIRDAIRALGADK